MSKRRKKEKKELRHNEYYEMQETFDTLYEQSLRGKEFDHLMGIIESPNNIKLAYRNIKRNKGSSTPGIDNLTIRQIEKWGEADLVRTVQRKLKHYQPRAVKRVEIPKVGRDKTRPLGIPSILDRIVQQCIRQVLEPICEAKFYKHSYGFRPDRSAEQAIARVQGLMQLSHKYFAVDMDIKGFFDNVNHTKLIKQLWTMGIRDKKLLMVIKASLKAPIILPSGERVVPTKGTPQGGVLSPLLANVVLNELDWWIASQWEKMPAHNVKDTISKADGHVNRSHAYRAFRKTSTLKEVFIVRYADDFKIFCTNRNDAERILIATKKWLKERLNLDIAEEKSGITDLRKGYTNFLGFKLKLRRKSGKWVVESHICDKSKKLLEITLLNEVKKIQHPKDGIDRRRAINSYNSKVLGMHNYFKIATHVQKDFDEIAYRINKVIKNRLAVSRTGKLNPNGVIAKEYGSSKQLRFVEGMPLIPIGYIRTCHAKAKKQGTTRYSAEGRRLLESKSLKIDLSQLRLLMEAEPKTRYSIEFVDNRISKFCEQYGKCAVTGKQLFAHEIHCHHVTPIYLGGTDRYENLVIVHEDVHRLIHATTEATIRKYIPILENDKEALRKVNYYRKIVGNEKISFN